MLRVPTIEREREREFIISINLQMFSILQTHQRSSRMLFHVKAWLSQWRAPFNALWETRVCRTSTRHFNGDHHLQDPPGRHGAPGLHGSISPSDEKKESHGTRRSAVCSSCPLRLTGAPICPSFQQRQRGPACREWNIYWARGCQFCKRLSVSATASEGLR